MLIKVIRFKRKTPRRTTQLRRLLKYLLTPKLIESTGGRLMGPPQFDHLVVTKTPWGDVLEHFVTDIVEQFDFYAREAGVCQKSCAKASLGCKGLGSCIGRDKPNDWYVHIIFSFSPEDKSALRSPPDPHNIPAKRASSTSNLIRIAKDALDFLGWDQVQPAVFVAHSDKEHPHVHAVIATALFPDGYWDVFQVPTKPDARNFKPSLGRIQSNEGHSQAEGVSVQMGENLQGGSRGSEIENLGPHEMTKKLFELT